MTDVQKADIIRLRSEGQSFGKIAAALELSVNTVKSFCSRNKDSRLSTAEILCSCEKIKL